jgi:hypothetical protein
MTTLEIADRINAARRELAVLALATQGLRHNWLEADAVAGKLFDLGVELDEISEDIHPPKSTPVAA